MPSENMPAPAMDQMRSALVPSARKPRLLPILLAVAVVIVIIIVVVLGSVFMS
jgi:t-SNARE complex subunit (syntaxin)